jgi:hypothetical protein
MHTRRLSLLILGLFLGLTAAMLLVATHNFSGVEELLAHQPDEARKMLAKLDPEQRRMLLRYQASELNRFYFQWYLNAQIVLILALTVNVFLAVKGSRFLLAVSAAIAIVVILQRLVLLPEIEYLGHAIDFIPPSTASPARQRFWSFHRIFSGVEVVKIAASLLLGIKMLVRSDTRRRAQKNDLQEEIVGIR